MQEDTGRGGPLRKRLPQYFAQIFAFEAFQPVSLLKHVSRILMLSKPDGKSCQTIDLRPQNSCTMDQWMDILHDLEF